ncbi:MAG: hypothetical protein AAGK04_05185 [Planctomycetota bacterium]
MSLHANTARMHTGVCRCAWGVALAALGSMSVAGVIMPWSGRPVISIGTDARGIALFEEADLGMITAEDDATDGLELADDAWLGAPARTGFRAHAALGLVLDGGPEPMRVLDPAGASVDHLGWRSHDLAVFMSPSGGSGVPLERSPAGR